MPTVSQDVITRIRDLPPLPLVARKLLEVMADDGASATDVTEVLSSDQALASKVLRLVNSSFYGLSGQIGTVSRGVVVMGFSALRNLALGLGVASTIQKAARGLDVAPFWQHAITTAAAARTIAERSPGRADPEEAFIAGLLHDLGTLLLEMVAPGYTAQIASTADTEILDAEQAHLGITHTKAGQKLLRHWRLPEPLGQAVRFHHHPDAFASDPSGLTATVALADAVAQVFGHSGEASTGFERILAVAGHLGLSLRDTGSLLARTSESIAHTVAFLQIAGVTPPTGGEATTGSVRRVVVLGADAERAGWILGLVMRAGHEPVSMNQFLGEPAVARATDLVIVEPTSLDGARVARLGRVLAPLRDRVSVFGRATPDVVAHLGGGLPVLPATFSAVDLQAVLPGEPAMSC